MEPDFSGYVTKYGLRCSDGRTILAHAFKSQDGQQLPLVWQHGHKEVTNVLGHVKLEHRDDGVYAQGFLNDTPNGNHARTLVKNSDISKMSIYANHLVQQGMSVTHGNLVEASLVLAGANPGAQIDNVNIRHGDGDVTELDDEVIIHSGESFEHASVTVPPPSKVDLKKNDQSTSDSSDSDDNKKDSSDSDMSIEDVVNSMSPQQKKVLYGLVGQAAAKHSDIEHDQKGDTDVTRNVFDQSDDNKNKSTGNTLTHSDAKEIFDAARKPGATLKSAVEDFALAHGIESIDTLFPYDQAVTDSPEWISRRMEWVAGVLGGTRKTPFSRIRSWTADITQEEARAKGYITGNMKKEEFFAVARRITTPQTVYKKQKLDRDDILDITDFNVVTWLQAEMRIMLDEEIARAVLIGDGRDVDDEDKINESNIRPIATDVDMYNTTVSLATPVASSTDPNAWDAVVDQVVEAMRFYRGSGNPVLYTTLPILSKLLLIKDTLGRRLYPTKVELASAMGVSGIIPCEALEVDPTLIGVIVNLTDYTVGADKGGEVSMFDFFDIDYNQYKYLIESRLSGAMTKYKGALTLRTTTDTVIADSPTAPTQDGNTVTVPTMDNVTYAATDKSGSAVTVTSGTFTLTSSNSPVTVTATAADGYVFGVSADTSWTFNYQAS